MNDERPITGPALIVLGLAAAVALVLVLRSVTGRWLPFGDDESDGRPSWAAAGGPKYGIRPGPTGTDDAGGGSLLPDETVDEWIRRLLDWWARTASQTDALDGQMVLRFRDEETLRKFLSRAEALGIDVVARLDALNAVRISFDSISDLKGLSEFDDDLTGLEGNFLVVVPDIPAELPEADQRAGGAPPVGIGSRLLAAIGAGEDVARFGDGVKIAILDSGVVRHPSFENVNLRAFDLVDPDSRNPFIDPVGHGTAVASLIAGTLPEAPGVAPSADLLVYRVTDANGSSDSFTLAQGLMAAVDAGADLVNISLGSYGDSPLMRDAIEYAKSRNVLVVASAGNDTLTDAAFPARYPDVVSVGASDGAGQLLWFSNASDSLNLVAPGYQVNVATPGTEDSPYGAAAFSGTSASTPVVTGSLAAVMSQLAIRNPTEALAVLQNTANENGPPGYDAEYGTGTLNLERAMQSDTRGIRDAAVVQPFYDTDNSYGYGANQLLFMVENRGTESLFNVPITVRQAGTEQSNVFPRLDPDQTAVFPVPVSPTALAETPGGLRFDVSLYHGTESDAKTDNNRLSTSLAAPPQPESGSPGS